MKSNNNFNNTHIDRLTVDEDEKITHHFLSVFSPFTFCASSDRKIASPDMPGKSMYILSSTGSKMKIKIGSHTFNATLLDNKTAAAFQALLPLKLYMVELNGNEKYVDLTQPLPTDALNPGTIHSGDLMLYGSSMLVLFYKTFPTSYSYTKLARIDDSVGLEAAVGAGNVTVSFELQ